MLYQHRNGINSGQCTRPYGVAVVQSGADGGDLCRTEHFCVAGRSSAVDHSAVALRILSRTHEHEHTPTSHAHWRAHEHTRSHHAPEPFGAQHTHLPVDQRGSARAAGAAGGNLCSVGREEKVQAVREVGGLQSEHVLAYSYSGDHPQGLQL